MVTAQCLTDSRLCQVVLSPNNSDSRLQSIILLSSISLILLLVGAVFAWHGLWVVLPFAGLEVLALWIALAVVSKGSARRQVITIESDRVRVEKGSCQHRYSKQSGPQVCFEYPRSWARLSAVPAKQRWYPSRLLIGASGQHVEIGEFLTEEERQELAIRLKQWL
ncbi:MAG: DUF2244 domain-containing protein [bacterium]